MKKVDRPSEQKPAAPPYAGGQDPKRTEPERRAPHVPEKDQNKNLDSERSDRATSGRPVQLEDEAGQPKAEPDFGDRQRDVRQDRKPAEGEPIKR